MQRESFRSRLGFLLVSAGCAIGIGNVWRFPYVAGQNGGGLFVLLYLIFLVLMGVPVLTMELAVGRASRKSAVLGYKKLEKPKSKWHIHGWLCMIGCYLLMMFYTPVSAWMLDYFYKFATGTFKSGMNSEQVSGVFNNLMASPVEMIIWLAIIVVFGFFVCSRGLQKGIEKVSKVMMVALLALIIILAINSMMLSNAGEGLSFYLVPDFGKVKDVGLGKVITSAMSQAFFTLGLGIASMEIFGSYMNKDRTLYGEAVQVVTMDSSIKSIADLKGKSVSIGAPGSGVYFNAIDMLTAAGLTENDITAQYLSFNDSADGLKDGKIDAAFIVAGPPTPAITELTTTTGATLVPIDGEIADKVMANCPYYTKYTIPAGTYNGQETDIVTVAVKATLIVAADTDEETVYNITKAIFDNAEAIAAENAKGAELSIENATSGMTAPFHKGAAKYFAEKGVTVTAE